MFTSGTKVSPNEQLGKREYPELTAKEYTVEFCFMFDSMTYVVFKELPNKVFNRHAFDYTGTGKKDTRTSGFAVKTSQGGYLITDIEHLDRLEGLGKVFNFKKIQSKVEVGDYFCHCAVCDREVTEEEKYGILKRGDLCALVVCPECSTSTPEIKPFFPTPITYHDFSDFCIDYDELQEYGETIGRPKLDYEIEGEIDAVCNHCTMADEHPDCSPGECPYYEVEDYLALKHPQLLDDIRDWYWEVLRQMYPDPSEH